MTAKEYLCQVKEKQDKIVEKEEYIERLRGTLEVAGIRYDVERVQSSSDLDRFSKTFSKIFEAEDELKQMKEDFVLFRINVIDMIFKLPDEYHRKILNHVYIDFMTLKKCAEKIHLSYDYVRELHIQALSVFESMFPQ